MSFIVVHPSSIFGHQVAAKAPKFKYLSNVKNIKSGIDTNEIVDFIVRGRTLVIFKLRAFSSPETVSI